MIAIACDHGGYNLKLAVINYLEENNRSDWKEYIKKRKEITEQTKETIIWQ